MRGRIVRFAFVAGLLAAPTSAPLAQTSAGYKLQEHVLNCGGSPAAGQALASADFRLSLSSVGEGVARSGLASASWRIDAGFASAFPPPSEVRGVRFASDHVSLSWNPERSVGAYELYRGNLHAPLPGYGTCRLSGLTTESAADTESPVVRTGFFYLVTARNRLTEEGTKGLASSGAERSNPSPCP